MFMDNDDVIDPNYIDTFLKENDLDYDIINAGYIRETYAGKTIFKRVLKNDDLAPYIQLACWGKLYKADYIKNFKFLKSPIADDFYFNVLAYNNTDKIKSINYTGYHWLFNDASLSNTSNKGLKDTDNLLKVLEEIDIKLKKKDDLIDYFYLRTIIYYVLFSCKKVKKDILITEYNKMIKWIDDKNVNYHKNKYVGIFKNNSEEFSVKFIIRMFLFLKRINIMKPFLILYSKI